jgi:hypothetical protein
MALPMALLRETFRSLPHVLSIMKSVQCNGIWSYMSQSLRCIYVVHPCESLRGLDRQTRFTSLPVAIERHHGVTGSSTDMICKDSICSSKMPTTICNGEC